MLGGGGQAQPNHRFRPVTVPPMTAPCFASYIAGPPTTAGTVARRATVFPDTPLTLVALTGLDVNCGIAAAWGFRVVVTAGLNEQQTANEARNLGDGGVITVVPIVPDPS